MSNLIPSPQKGLPGGQYQPLTPAQIERIHQASLQILERTGVQVEEKEALELFKKAGASVDGNRVRIPLLLIEKILKSARSSVLLAGRNPENDLHLEGKRVHIGTGGAALQVLDLKTDSIRAATLQDAADMALLVDALPNIHFYLLPIYPTDIPEESVEISKYFAGLVNTTKHVQAGVYTSQGLHDVVAMAERIAGGSDALRKRPLVSFITSWMVSPLMFATDVTRLLIEVCKLEMPVVLSSAPMAGSTSPITLAGTLAQLNAEQLSGLALTQLVNPGTPVLIGPIPATADMRSGNYLGGSIELGIANAAISQMAHYYNLPIYNSAGMTDSKLPDIQAGIEKTQSLIQVALAGSNFIHHAAGMLEDMSTIAYEQFVIDNEILGMAMRAVRGIEVSDEALALDAIDRVGPGSHFLSDQHTLQHMRTEHYFPGPVIHRKGREEWEAEGKTDARSRALSSAREILNTHQPDPIDQKTINWIKKEFSETLILTQKTKI
jgi:trimethylamine---corrinoid protein Co-methyltransferase